MIYHVSLPWLISADPSWRLRGDVETLVSAGLEKPQALQLWRSLPAAWGPPSHQRARNSSHLELLLKYHKDVLSPKKKHILLIFLVINFIRMSRLRLPLSWSIATYIFHKKSYMVQTLSLSLSLSLSVWPDNIESQGEVGIKSFNRWLQRRRLSVMSKVRVSLTQTHSQWFYFKV